MGDLVAIGTGKELGLDPLDPVIPEYGMTKSELRLLHEVGRSDGRPAHIFRKRPDFRPGDIAYYECKCGAQSGRFWNLLTQEEEAS